MGEFKSTYRPQDTQYNSRKQVGRQWGRHLASNKPAPYIQNVYLQEIRPYLSNSKKEGSLKAAVVISWAAGADSQQQKIAKACLSREPHAMHVLSILS